MKFLVSGGTGALGQALLPELARRGHSALVLSRSPTTAQLPQGMNALGWDARTTGSWQDAASGVDGVIHLAGQGIFEGRWNARSKREIVDSRLASTRLLASTLLDATPRPRLWISASAVGFYGDTGESRVDEEAKPGSDFLAELCLAWERECEPARQAGVRVVNPRIGVVLQRGHGALARMVPLFRSFAGGYFGGGEQWFPWIHVNDLVAALLRPLEDESLAGPVNLVAPGEIRFQDFARTLGRLLSRPCWRIPSFAARIGLGEAATALFASQRIAPSRLVASGFDFSFPDAEPALRDLLAEPVSLGP